MRCSNKIAVSGFLYKWCRGFTTSRHAELAVNGDCFAEREILVKRRRKDVRMNSKVRDLQEPRKKS